MPRVTQSTSSQRLPAARVRKGGFSLIELIVVLAITTVMAALLMPGLKTAREGARRLICASNERQIGVGFALFAKDENERLPDSWFQEESRFAEMMALSSGRQRTSSDPHSVRESTFEGIGYFLPNAGGYCDSYSCFYCPSHSGEHTLDAYNGKFHGLHREPVYSNYHYTGDQIETEKGYTRRLFGRSADQVLLTDGLRTKTDFSHKNGMNVLRGDGSVQWKADVADQISQTLPMTVPDTGFNGHEHIEWIWNSLNFRD